MSRVTHYRSAPTGYTACSKDSPRLVVTDVEADVTCSNGQPAVFPQQESGGMSLRIKVGAFVGRYNLNSGIWEDDK